MIDNIDNIKHLSRLISIISNYISNDLFFTFKGKKINEKQVFDNIDDIKNIYFKNVPLNKFITDIKNNKYGFKLNSLNESCYKFQIFDKIDAKCISKEIYIDTDNDITIQLIYKNLDLQSSYNIYKVIYNNKNNVIIYINNDHPTFNISHDDKLKSLSLIATTFNSSIKSSNDKKKIISKFINN